MAEAFQNPYLSGYLNLKLILCKHVLAVMNVSAGATIKSVIDEHKI